MNLQKRFDQLHSMYSDNVFRALLLHTKVGEEVHGAIKHTNERKYTEERPLIGEIVQKSGRYLKIAIYDSWSHVERTLVFPTKSVFSFMVYNREQQNFLLEVELPNKNIVQVYIPLKYI